MCCNTLIWHGTMSLICVTWLIYICDMTHSFVWWWVVTHSYVWHVSFICVTHSRVRRDSYICCTLRIRVYVRARCDSFICVTCLVYTCDMTDSFVWHDVSTHVMWAGWFIRMCDTSHSQVWHDSFTFVTCLIYSCDMTHPYLWHEWFMWEMVAWNLLIYVTGPMQTRPFVF